MTYEVKHEEHSVHFLTFDSEDEFKEWEDEGSCISDLNLSQIRLTKRNIYITELEEG